MHRVAEGVKNGCQIVGNSVRDREGIECRQGKIFGKRTGAVDTNAGGVAANLAIRQKMEALCEKSGWQFFAPELKYCGDNGAMIAYAGCQRLQAGQHESLAISVQARWPMEQLSPL